ncbi:MAG: sialidase family protein, partial [Pirellulales bacterium]
RASYDEGQTWPYKRTIYEGGSGYSDMAVLPNGKIGYLFEKDGKQDLGFTVLPGPPAEPAAADAKR